MKLKLREKINKLPCHSLLHHGSTTLSLRALISATGFNMKRSNSGDKSRKRIKMNQKSRRRTKLLWKKSRNQGYQRFKDGFQKRGRSIPNGVNIIVWIVYVYCSVLQLVASYQYELGLFFVNLALIPRKPCHAPLPKIRRSGDATRVGDAYTQGKYLTYTR